MLSNVNVESTKNLISKLSIHWRRLFWCKD